eukprot:TRINITY_DN12174_c0_g1_i1.p1 TRINITY_DN12174_c0_g1~~TRINITY_DN12174_c0_g1_i1.p1  ORF type:complete len:666 (-),score=169.43 TRINITY_DN12174_c0_g1_i1:46-1752(-)
MTRLDAAKKESILELLSRFAAGRTRFQLVVIDPLGLSEVARLPDDDATTVVVHEFEHTARDKRRFGLDGADPESSSESEPEDEDRSQASGEPEEEGEHDPAVRALAQRTQADRRAIVRAYHETRSDVVMTPPSAPKAGDARVGVLYEEVMTLHEARRPHPERPERAVAIHSRLKRQGLLGRCYTVNGREIDESEITSVHSEKIVLKKVDYAWERGDMFANEDTPLAASVSAGSTVRLVELTMKGELDGTFGIVRPPGHHAEHGECMGFCFYNNVAIAAKLIQKAGCKRIAIIDWDVHHGNGTQNMFYEDDGILYISTHRYGRGFYPGTGSPKEIGSGKGKGYNINVAWTEPKMGDNEYAYAFQRIVMPVLRQYNPHTLIVSAGFDAARGDPLGGMDLTAVGYRYMTAQLRRVCPRVSIVLEGGYNLKSISLAAEGCVRVLLGEDGDSAIPAPISQSKVHPSAVRDVETLAAQLSSVWPNINQTLGPAALALCAAGHDWHDFLVDHGGSHAALRTPAGLAFLSTRAARIETLPAELQKIIAEQIGQATHGEVAEHPPVARVFSKLCALL